VRFLNHPEVQSSPLGKRMAFLKHKGLNDAEIALALKHANITPQYDIKRAIYMELADSAATAAASTTTTSAATPPPLPAERAPLLEPAACQS